jgi:Zn-dependent peptidase ImmA (M78 family)
VPYSRDRYQDKWALERRASSIRRGLGLSQTDILDPWQLADEVSAHVFYLEDLVAPSLAERASHIEWDGFAFCYPGESHLMVLLNSVRLSTRQCATLLEELSHHLLAHRPSRLYIDPVIGQLRREYDQSQEHEAYDLGSTILMPKELIQFYIRDQGISAGDLANKCGCSVDYVHFRIKRCRLWHRYTAAI